MINSVYNYYLTTYAGKHITKYDTHKKSELKDIYNTFVKLNKKSPLYKIDSSEDIQKYAIDLKEISRNLKNVSEAFSSTIDSGTEAVQKKAVSSNENILDVTYIGEDTPQNSDPLNISVQKLASPQINTGEYLSNSECKLSAGEYSFDCKINGNIYEFQFNIHNGDTNQDIQNRLESLFNRSSVGLEAHIINSPSGNTALEVRSSSTGVLEYSGETFSISPNSSEDSEKMLRYFGISSITNMPENATFTINGTPNTSPSNTFTINKQFEVTLKDINDVDDEPVSIGFKHDIDTLIENTHSLLNAYNDILSLANNKATDSYEGQRLLKEIKFLPKYHLSELESFGIKSDENGYLILDESLISQAVEEDGLSSIFKKLSEFNNDISLRADSIFINPMHYVNKTMISYPNPIASKTHINPYVSSIYTGMMFNGYI